MADAEATLDPVSAPQLLTIDQSVVIDRLDERQERHELALRLFDLAREGVVELALASSGHIFDAKGNATEQQRKLGALSVSSTPQLAYPGVMFPGANAWPGAFVPGFSEAWKAVQDDWKTHEGRVPGGVDALHVETHVLVRREVFITDDRALGAMCHRLHEEHSIPVIAMSLAEYLQELGAATSTR